MKIGIYDSYLDSLGGGERYMLTIASILSSEHDVFVFWDGDRGLLQKASERFGLDLASVKFTSNIFKSRSIIKRYLETRTYDVIVYLTDGSVPFLFSEKNILHFQFPITGVRRSIVDIIKFYFISDIISNSKFVKSYIDKTFHIRSLVLYPPVDLIKKGKKENIILSVGRFTKAMNMKKQEMMIEVFIKMVDKGLKKWRLVFIGASLSEDSDFVESLKKKAKGYPIEILENATYSRLKEFYAKSKIYWHAAGFGEDLEKHPERAEHFGISTVEAMSAGCVPVVFDGGGQKEIVEDNINGFLWKIEDELIDWTKQLMSERKLMEKMSENAQKRAIDFSAERFANEVRKLLVIQSHPSPLRLSSKRAPRQLAGPLPKRRG